MTRLFRQILRRRGLTEEFLRPDYEALFDPFELGEMELAVQRIERARDEGEKIVIYGDYDADGVTASVVMREALEYFGCTEVEVILPDRFVDGYGLGKTAIPEIKARGASLVVTVDCGSGSEAVIRSLREQGIETIVTDHHEIPTPPKSAAAVVNPKRTGERYGRRMAGVGVAFTVARALNMRKNMDDVEDARRCDGQEKWLLDLVAIGTICDAMELVEENRIMAAFGFKVMAKTRRVGLKELARAAKVNLEKMTAHAVGFQLGPRLNAAGRMKNAEVAYKLLATKSRAEAILEAEELESLNNERREAQEKAVMELGDLSGVDEPVLVVRGKWHEGVIGIIAGRLSEQYKKPSFAFTELGDGTLKGSGRSFGEFSLAKALAACPKGLLTSGGGHALACGATMKEADFGRFAAAINDDYRTLGLKNQEQYLAQKTEVALEAFAELTPELYEEIQALEPFGEGNLEPIFEISALVEGRRLLKEKHLSVTLRDKDGKKLRLMAFYAPEAWKAIKNGVRAKVQFTLALNEWHGQKTVEGNILSLEWQEII